MKRQGDLFSAPQDEVMQPVCHQEEQVHNILTDGRVYMDPGSDIDPDGSDLWLTLFTIADQMNHDLYSVLMYLRGTGLRLVPSEKFGFILQPIIDREGKKGWSSKDEYDREKKCLAPYRTKVTEALKKLLLWNPASPQAS